VASPKVELSASLVLTSPGRLPPERREQRAPAHPARPEPATSRRPAPGWSISTC